MVNASPCVAVIDIGSNSIKLLVAAAGPNGGIHELLRATDETRIGTGMGDDPPRLREAAMRLALEAIKRLLCRAAPFSPTEPVIVATSAVRDACNGTEFAAMVYDATTLELTILDGLDEARLIGQGIAFDPELRDEEAFYLFDLGGGSLEMLAFEKGAVADLASLPLGCVRVTGQCVPQPDEPLGDEVISSVRSHVRQTIEASGFEFTLPEGSVAVATGGTVATFRAIAAAAAGVRFAASSALIELDALEALATRVAEMNLAERRAIPGLPSTRADVFPAALLTLAETARIARLPAYRNSLYNLRYGVASELLLKAGEPLRAPPKQR